MPPLLALVIAFSSYPAIAIGLKCIYRFVYLSPEGERKLMHVVLGSCLLSLPWLIHSPWLAGIILSAFVWGPFVARHLRWANCLFGRTLEVERKNLGGPAFGLGMLLLFAFGHNARLFYAISACVLIFADSAAAIVGINFPLLSYRIFNSKKTVSGSMAFFSVAFLCIFVPLKLSGHYQTGPIVVLSFAISSLTTFIEAISPFGLDNLFIPLFVLAMLHCFHEGLFIVASNLLFVS